MPSVQSVHGYYPFAIEDGGRLAYVTAELVTSHAILVIVRRFIGMGVVDSRSLRHESYFRSQYVVCRSACANEMKMFTTRTG
jgi:hypothetical protein